LPGTVACTVFAESVPFSETRGYVKNVLPNATYCAALFDGKLQSLKSMFGHCSDEKLRRIGAALTNQLNASAGHA